MSLFGDNRHLATRCRYRTLSRAGARRTRSRQPPAMDFMWVGASMLHLTLVRPSCVGECAVSNFWQRGDLGGDLASGLREAQRWITLDERLYQRSRPCPRARRRGRNRCVRGERASSTLEFWKRFWPIWRRRWGRHAFGNRNHKWAAKHCEILVGDIKSNATLQTALAKGRKDGPF